jgi:hypothetical protein
MEHEAMYWLLDEKSKSVMQLEFELTGYLNNERIDSEVQLKLITVRLYLRNS